MCIRDRYPVTPSQPTIAYGAGVYVLFNNPSSLTYYTSSNGTTWTSRTRPSTAMYKLAFCKDRFFSGNTNAFYTSMDGINWSAPQTVGASSTTRQWAANNSIYVVIGSGVTAYWSFDAVTWNPVTLPGVTAYDGVAWNGSIWAAISSPDHATTSPDFVVWSTPVTFAGGHNWSNLYAKGPCLLYTSRCV